MSFTIDRINSLLARIGGEPIGVREIQLNTKTTEDLGLLYETWTPAHDVLDRIDRQVGIITRHLPDGELAPLGNRLRRLERHLDARQTPPYFWLGASAESAALAP